MNGSMKFCSKEKLSMPKELMDIHMMMSDNKVHCMPMDCYRSLSNSMENIQNKPMVMSKQQLVLMECSLNGR